MQKSPVQITEENVEESIEQAIARYDKIGAFPDAIFWSTVMELLKSKIRKDCEKEMKKKYGRK